MVVARPLLRWEDQLGSLHPSIRGDRMHQYQARAVARRFLDPWTFFSEIPCTRRRVIHIDIAFIEINFRTDRPPMRELRLASLVRKYSRRAISTASRSRSADLLRDVP